MSCPGCDFLFDASRRGKNLLESTRGANEDAYRSGDKGFWLVTPDLSFTPWEGEREIKSGKMIEGTNM